MPVSVAEKVGVLAAIGFEKASRIVMVTVEVLEPSATTGEVPVMVEVVVEAAPAMNVTVPSGFETGVAIARVFNSALVDVKVQVETPEALVAEHAP